MKKKIEEGSLALSEKKKIKKKEKNKKERLLAIPNQRNLFFLHFV
jgi:predicted GIY-YIG superfamily endonuclease